MATPPVELPTLRRDGTSQLWSPLRLSAAAAASNEVSHCFSCTVDNDLVTLK